MDILKTRLFNTGLSSSPFKNPADAVSHLGAVQAQDFAMAKWSLGLRTKNSAEKDIDKAYDDGDILRVHVMRPTWHFILPEDINWMTALTAPHVKAVMASSNRKLELDDKLITKTNNAIVKALQVHRYLTRQELKNVLASVRIETNVQRLAHIIMFAELDGLICSGPRRGKQFTYALTAERVANPKKLDREQALALLAQRYFASHGPALVEDFSWWSGLGIRDAREALGFIKSGLTQIKLNNKNYWFAGLPDGLIPAPPQALLLSIYDEYTIAYKDRSDISSARDIERMIQMGNALTAVIILGGRVVGSWNKASESKSVNIKLSPFRELTEKELSAVKAEAARYSRFLGMPVTLGD